MAREPRIAFAGAIYHIIVRGNRRQGIFRDGADRERFLDSLFERVDRYGIRLYMYCLMGNHFHLLSETPLANVSAFMESLQTSHSVYLNKRWKRSGHVYQGRFKSPLVEGNEYLLRLSRYLHLNPVCTREWKHKPLRSRCAALRRYRWSSLGAYVGQDEVPPELDTAPILALCGTELGDASPQGYQKYVETGLAQTDEELEQVMRRYPLTIGSASFRTTMLEFMSTAVNQRVGEDVVLRRIRDPLDPKRVVDAVCAFYHLPPESMKVRTRGSHARAVAAHLLIKHSGLTQRNVARWLGLTTGAAVSVQLRKVSEPQVMQEIESIERIL